ncbi:hydrogenase-4 component B [Geobacter sp. OR-1]|uniref:proton-conducting transporter transmembrane domain-containing protein n=1 Tax=Geobacter sp. OR-1 TaxID=1266765 RepID=UPI0005422F39|nr:proton-conducting transporter membrane subunit [Geobacter sp. OR-1]GAM11773.1 hydrogenase-4 component B [Geobacter sp. OR-1]
MSDWLTGVEAGNLLVAASLLTAVSGVPLLFRLLPPSAGQKLATLLSCLASLLGILGAVITLLQRSTVIYELPWPLPFGPATFAIDPLSALFTLPILIVSACCSIYSIDYWPAGQNLRTVRKLTFFFGLLVSAMLWVVMARATNIFLVAWEIMALAAYFVLTTDDFEPAVREAGTLYMICTHIGTLCLFAMFALLKTTSGSFVFPEAGSLEAAGPLPAAIFVVALFGFGFKAGIMPLHIWLPSAHANAPSHVSAIMSGVILKVGIYGLVRTLSFFSTFPLWWGITVLVLGIVSGIVGVVFAIGQHDLKRLLAYHSIENIGIIAMGIGIAMIGTATGAPLLALLGMAGALLHVINHATFKALLFLGAGSVIHAVGTREIDRMGGLLRHMPWTALFFLTGAVAICGLPPLNGFVSELLIYLGLFNGAVNGVGAGAAVAALAVPGLALIGGLAVACFVKVFGVVFLGVPRFPESGHPHEAGPSMRIPMAMLAVICVGIGVMPLAAAPLLESAVAGWHRSAAGSATLSTVAPLGWLSILAISLVAIAAAAYAARMRGRADRSVTWGCGYLAPTQRMQYTASSFADMIVALFSGILRPDSHSPTIKTSFPAATRFSSHVPEAVLEKIYLPLLQWANEKLAPVRRMQHGQIHFYILYTFLTLMVLIFISSP